MAETGGMAGTARGWQLFRDLRGKLARFCRRLWNLGQAMPRSLRLCESLSLGERRFVAVVEFDGEQFLVGGTASTLMLLARLGNSGPQPWGDADRRRLGSEDFIQTFTSDTADRGIARRKSEGGEIREREIGMEANRKPTRRLDDRRPDDRGLGNRGQDNHNHPREGQCSAQCWGGAC
jgi:hypothetical protein